MRFSPASLFRLVELILGYAPLVQLRPRLVHGHCDFKPPGDFTDGPLVDHVHPRASTIRQSESVLYKFTFGSRFYFDPHLLFLAHPTIRQMAGDLGKKFGIVQDADNHLLAFVIEVNGVPGKRAVHHALSDLVRFHFLILLADELIPDHCSSGNNLSGGGAALGLLRDYETAFDYAFAVAVWASFGCGAR